MTKIQYENLWNGKNMVLRLNLILRTMYQRKKGFLVLRYYRGADEIKNEIVQKSFPQVDFQFAFKSHSTIARSFFLAGEIKNFLTQFCRSFLKHITQESWYVFFE
jgi:hypothetical protein